MAWRYFRLRGAFGLSLPALLAGLPAVLAPGFALLPLRPTLVLPGRAVGSAIALPFLLLKPLAGLPAAVLSAPPLP